jgi:hypothetical protein
MLKVRRAERPTMLRIGDLANGAILVITGQNIHVNGGQVMP